MREPDYGEMIVMSAKPYVPEDLFRMRWVGSPRLSPCGKYAVFVVSEMLEQENGYGSSLWLYDSTALEHDPLSLRQISFHGGKRKGRDYNPKWSADGSKIAFLSDRAEATQIFVMDMLGGEASQVTSMPKGVADFDWLSDDSLVFSAKQDEEAPKDRKGATVRRITSLRYKFNGVGYLDGLHTQLWSVKIGYDGPIGGAGATHSPRQLTSGPYDCGAPVASPSGRYVAFASNRSGDERLFYSDLYVLTVDTGELKRLTQGEGSFRGPVFAPDETALYCIGHAKGQPYPGAYPDIWRIDLATLERTLVSTDFPHFIGGGIGGDVGPDPGNPGLSVSPGGKHLYFTAVDGGSSYLYRVDVESGKWRQVFGEGQMVVKSYHLAGGRLIANVATPASMGDLWYGRLPGNDAYLNADGQVEGEVSPQSLAKMVTGFNSALAAERYAGWPKRVEFENPEGGILEGWVILPSGFEKGKKYPLVMEIHGGPHTTYGNVFFHEFQVLAGHGFGVFYANPRGSMGYGEEFARAVVGDWCGADARDLEFMARKVLQMLGWVDSKRFGVTGGSQGGYFTNWLIGHTDIFAAAVTQRSMSNLYSKYGVSDIGWYGDRAGMGGKDLWDDEDFIMERSPIRYARNVKTPTLLIHSDQDYRCPLEQAEQWYVALKRLGVPAEMLLFHGENHELSRGGKPANRVVRLEGILEWFSRYLT